MQVLQPEYLSSFGVTVLNQPLAAPSASLVVAAQSTGPARLAAPGLRQLLWMPWLRAKQSFGISYNFCAHLIFETGKQNESNAGEPGRATGTSGVIRGSSVS